MYLFPYLIHHCVLVIFIDEYLFYHHVIWIFAPNKTTSAMTTTITFSTSVLITVTTTKLLSFLVISFMYWCWLILPLFFFHGIFRWNFYCLLITLFSFSNFLEKFSRLILNSLNRCLETFDGDILALNLASVTIMNIGNTSSVPKMTCRRIRVPSPIWIIKILVWIALPCFHGKEIFHLFHLFFKCIEFGGQHSFLKIHGPV